MVNEEILKKLKERYKNIHPLIFHRSIEKSKKDVDLFDILDAFPKEFPVVWCEEDRKWEKTDNIFQIEDFFEK